jgi:hypothetical protein
MPVKAVAFLDLLGFSAAVKNDPAGAVGLLQDQSSALHDAIADAKLHQLSEYEDAKVRQLAEAGLVTSFDDFLPMSDSVFIASGTPSLFVKQVSHLLVDLFRFRLNAYASPESGGDPRQVTMRSVEFSGGSVKTTKHEATWWPVLYRGGLAYGDVWTLKMPAISGEPTVQANLAGPAVVEAVGLERTAGKPALFTPFSRGGPTVRGLAA